MKSIKCLKCHKEFKTELDKFGIPYQKICDTCTLVNKKMRNSYFINFELATKSAKNTRGGND